MIAALEALTKEQQVVSIYLDARYVVDAVEKGWLAKWLAKDFKNKKNADLWKKFWMLYQQHQVKFYWVKGHAGNELNERCDQLALQCIQKGPLGIDEGYENCLQNDYPE